MGDHDENHWGQQEEWPECSETGHLQKSDVKQISLVFRFATLVHLVFAFFLCRSSSVKFFTASSCFFLASLSFSLLGCSGLGVVLGQWAWSLNLSPQSPLSSDKMRGFP
ncbi:uncharacterized protein BDW70DRAFT_142898 [Aspergillus foveolatus]|uniref:uncharacterized protein n=1 Tax=Aspergillus foveolatus TaxID=210207 RepID=UPI003CCE2FF2